MSDSNIKNNNNNKYLKKFIEKNSDKINEKIVCPICSNTYTYFNKSKHYKTKIHLAVSKIMNSNKTNNITI